MSVQHKKNFTKLDNHDHILVKKGLGAVARRFIETRKVRLRDGKVFFLFIRILFFSKNATYFVIDPPGAYQTQIIMPDQDVSYTRIVCCWKRETSKI